MATVDKKRRRKHESMMIIYTHKIRHQTLDITKRIVKDYTLNGIW